MAQLIGKSIHVTWEELACKDGTPYPIEFIKDGRVIELVVMFEKIRAIWAKPIIINSAYRTLAYNESIGGALDSQHTHGKALDLHPPEGVTIERFYSTIKDLHVQLGVTAMGKYKTWVHVDFRDSDKLVEWVG